MVVAQAQKVDAAGDRVTFTFSAAQRALCDQVEQHRAWLESLGTKIAGRKIAVAVVQQAAGAAPAAPATPGDAAKTATLREQAMADAGVQALLEVFPAEIRDVEEM
jgi:hypothetical protein